MFSQALKSKVFTLTLIAVMAILQLQFVGQQANFVAKAQIASSPFNPLTDPSVATDSNFSIIWITDTQYLSESYPLYFNSLCRWIVNNAATYNVKMVIHTGDIVNDEGSQLQWANANNSMSILLDAGIPYCWNAGNHDFNATCWIGDQFTAFNGTFMSNKPYWVGSQDNSMDTAVHFDVSGWDFLIVNLAYQANDSDLAWANSVLDAHPDSHAIVATHAYLNRTGGYESWANHFREVVLATHTNVFLALNGHYYPTDGVRTAVGGRNELMFNRQDQDDEMGAASLRILTFDTANDTLSVRTFVIYANTFLTDSNNQFSLNTTFHNDSPQDAKVPEFPDMAVAVLCLSIATSAVVILKIRLKQHN